MIPTSVVDDFFDNFHNIKNEFKSIKLYSLEESKKLGFIPEGVVWPGKRSYNLNITNPFLFNLLIKEYFDKFKDILPYNQIQFKSVIHLRLSSDNSQDYIHTDNDLATLIVYLSDTNLKSGTALYPDNSDIPDTIIKAKQNRAIIFDAKKRHKSLLNYGNNIDDGRLTLNVFLNETKND